MGQREKITLTEKQAIPRKKLGKRKMTMTLTGETGESHDEEEDGAQKGVREKKENKVLAGIGKETTRKEKGKADKETKEYGK